MATATQEKPKTETDQDLAQQAFAEEQAAREEKVALNLEAIMALPEVEARIAAVAAQAASLAVAQAMGVNSPPKVLQAKVHDRFITEANGRGDVLRHFRCENAVATKIIELDMTRMRKYESGELEIPLDAKGRPKSIISLCAIPGSYITFVDTHCYAYTDNQVEQILWLRDQPSNKGGMPGIYEDYGVAADAWVCEVCTEPKRTFTDRKTWEEHRYRTHRIAPGQ